MRLSQGPKHVIGELPIKPGCAYRNLKIYKTHHITGHTSIHLKSEQHKRNSVQYIPSDVCSNFQAMLLHPEHPALLMGNPVIFSLHGKGTSSRDVTHPSVPAAARSAQFQQFMAL